jgi:hypothetical protein
VSGPCTPVQVRQSAHPVIACQFSLTRGASATISFSWRVPSVVTKGQSSAYQLYVQRQPGTANTAQVTVTPAPGTTLVGMGGPGALTGGRLVWTQSPQKVDATLLVGVQSSPHQGQART